MQQLYFILAAVHIAAVPVTGILWTIIILKPNTPLKRYMRDNRAVHFGSLYLAPWFLGLAWAFERLSVPWWHQAAFPAGLGLLIVFSSVGYMLPRPRELEPFYFWTRGTARTLSIIGLAFAVVGLIWTAVALAYYALAAPA